MNVHDAISLTLIPFVFAPVAIYLVTHNDMYLYIFIATILAGLSAELVSKAMGKITDNKIFYRPPEQKNCGLLNGETKPQDPSFPPAHMTLVTFLIIVLLYTGNDIQVEHDNVPSKTSTYIWSALYVVLMAFSRYSKHCNNIPQIICGIVYGVICAALFIYGLTNGYYGSHAHSLTNVP